MSLVSKNQTNKIEPGKKIDYISGEILSIKLNQWGITGKLEFEGKEYDYKLKDPEMIKNMLIGMDLVIYNGFCFKNKKDEEVITDGKFGRTNVQINLGRYYGKKDNQGIITGIIKSIDCLSGKCEIKLKQLFSCEKYHLVIFSDDRESKFCKIKEQREFFTNKIARLSFLHENEQNTLETLEILPEDHFWYKFEKIKRGFVDDTSYFMQVISNHRSIIENYYENLRGLFLNSGKDISKNDLVKLKDLLYSKILNDDLKFPNNILLQRKEIESYCDTMIEFFRNLVIKYNSYDKPEELLNILKYYYPPLKL